jgi:hypothetical protein
VEPAVLYYGTFGPGTRSQTSAISWAFNDFVWRFDEELKAGRHCVHMQAYDIGGGQMRYDGIWEPAAAPQQRVLGLPLWSFADAFDELTSSGMHIEHMSACLRVYADLPAVSRNTAPGARRTVTFGSDHNRTPAALAPLPLPPFSTRGPGCDLGR